MPKPPSVDAETRTTSIRTNTLRHAGIAAKLVNESVTEFISKAVDTRAESLLKRAKMPYPAPDLSGE